MAGRRLVIYLQTNINKNESINFRTPRCVYLHLYFYFTTMLTLNRKERNNKISVDVRDQSPPFYLLSKFHYVYYPNSKHPTIT